MADLTTVYTSCRIVRPFEMVNNAGDNGRFIMEKTVRWPGVPHCGHRYYEKVDGPRSDVEVGLVDVIFSTERPDTLTCWCSVTEADDLVDRWNHAAGEQGKQLKHTLDTCRQIIKEYQSRGWTVFDKQLHWTPARGKAAIVVDV